MEDIDPVKYGAMYQKVQDLDRKLSSAQFNVDQLEGGRAFFMQQLERQIQAMDKAETA